MSFLFPRRLDLAQTLQPSPQVDSPLGKKGAHPDIQGSQGATPGPQVHEDTTQWSLMASHRPVVVWDKGSFMCRMGQGNTGPGVASISEALRVPQGLPSPNRGTPWVPWLSLHMHMLHSWALWGGLEQMTDRDTDDMGAAVHDGGIIGQSVDHHPGQFPILKDSRPLGRSFL